MNYEFMFRCCKSKNFILKYKEKSKKNKPEGYYHPSGLLLSKVKVSILET